MRDKRGFWLGVGGAFVGASGFIIFQFARSSQTGEGGPAWLMAAAMALSIVPIVFAIAFGSSVVAGWARRAKMLEAARRWDVIAPIMKSEQMAQELVRVNPAGATRRVPRGLTLTADQEGIGIWSGRQRLALEVWLPWANVEDVQPTMTRDILESYRGIAISVHWGVQRVSLPFPVTGSFPFGARIATAQAIEELIGSLNHARHKGMWETSYPPGSFSRQVTK